jgi:hypothetical protein
VFCKPCLDWTERRYHVAGAVGAAFCAHCVSAGWVRRLRDNRAVEVSDEGRAALSDLLGIDARTLTYRAPEGAAARGGRSCVSLKLRDSSGVGMNSAAVPISMASQKDHANARRQVRGLPAKAAKAHETVAFAEAKAGRSVRSRPPTGA